MISAMLASGRCVPAEHGLSIEDLSCWEKLWRFCVDYQARAGAAPGLEIIRSRFPEFVFLPSINIDWAADQLHSASYSRNIRQGFNGALRAIAEDDMETVQEIIGSLAQPRRHRNLTGLDSLDAANLMATQRKEGLPLPPWKPLVDVTTVIGFDELWTLGSFTGHGKSQILPLVAAIVAEAGYTARYLSLEMPAASINRRVIRCYARGDRDMQLRLAHPDPRERFEALDELRGRVPGKVETLDPSDMVMNTHTVEDATNGADIVMVDHIGLLQLPDGTRAIDDWRGLAKISNILREINLRTKTAMLNASQTNKESNRNGLVPPKLGDFSGSIAVPQDSDVVLTMRKPCDGLLVFGCEKNRENIGARWYTRFDPSKADYRELTKAEAHNLDLAGQDREANL